MDKELAICHVCGKQLKQVTNSHVKQHQLSMDEYRNLYPNAILAAPGYAQERSESASRANFDRRGVPRTQEVKDKVSKANKGKEAWNKGISPSDEVRERLSKIAKEAYASGERTHWNTGNTTPQETKDKISASLTGYIPSEEAKENHYTAIQKYRNSEDYVPPMLGKRHSEDVKLKMSNSSVIAMKPKKDKATRRITEHLAQYNIELQHRDGTLFHLKCNICNTEFQRTKGIFDQNRYDDYNGEYCHTCHPPLTGGYWGFESFESFPERKLIPGRLYLIEAFNENEKFLKVGITTRKVSQRYTGFEYDYRVLIDKEMNMYEAYCIEQKMLTEYKKFRHYPKIFFGGMFECIQLEVKEKLIQKIMEENR